MQKKNDDLLRIVYDEIKNNNRVTEKEIAKKYFYSERTIRRYVKILKEEKKVKLVNFGKKKIWELIE